MGDFNLPDVDWESRSIEGTQYPKLLNDTFLNFCFDNQLEKIVTEQTRGKNILDLFFTNSPSLVSKCLIKPSLSDHDAVFVEAAYDQEK